MRACAAMLLCAAVAAAAVVAAPAPAPRTSGPWFDGWEKPVNPLGDCRFERQGDRLTVTLRGKTGAAHAKLLRDVEGDFAVEGRVEVTPDPRADRGEAGLLLADDKQKVYLARKARSAGDDQVAGVYLHTVQAGQGGDTLRVTAMTLPGPPAGKPVYLRLERRGDSVLVKFSAGGKGWDEPHIKKELKLPHKLKVGVLAQVGGDAEFKATFDQFRLTPLAPDGSPLKPTPGDKAR